MKSIAELVTASQSGDQSAFAELVTRHERAMTVAAWAILGDFHAAQDVTQESFVIAYKNLDQLREPSAFVSWMFIIVRREAARTASRASKEQPDLEIEQLTDATHPNSWPVEYEDVFKAINRLPDHEQLIVIFRYVDGRSVQEIADMTERPVGTVTKQLSRAIKRLQKWLVEVIS